MERPYATFHLLVLAMSAVSVTVYEIFTGTGTYFVDLHIHDIRTDVRTVPHRIVQHLMDGVMLIIQSSIP